MRSREPGRGGKQGRKLHTDPASVAASWLVLAWKSGTAGPRDQRSVSRKRWRVRGGRRRTLNVKTVKENGGTQTGCPFSGRLDLQPASRVIWFPGVSVPFVVSELFYDPVKCGKQMWV